ncbi:hypothetical protein L6452_21142 [Arctium lappa]|uniref:Uncharacterized protein n=1 Tax=Arctium lappa TaxID=4217 RepID=A0ACB9BCX4_ARCLA|nr:hypothetical protein L6452_21142 [Arctium lappa]
MVQAGIFGSGSQRLHNKIPGPNPHESGQSFNHTFRQLSRKATTTDDGKLKRDREPPPAAGFWHLFRPESKSP